MNALHVQPWWGNGRSLGELEAEYRPCIAKASPIRAYIAWCAHRPVGFIEWTRMGDFPDFQRAYGVDNSSAANCDVLIGEPDAVYRGFGAPLLVAFLREYVFADARVQTCLMDPEPDNARAIRAYEKAGFRFVRALPEDGEGHGVYLMELTRAEFLSPSAPEHRCYIRPARAAELPIAVAIDDDACSAYATLGPDFALDLPSGHSFIRAEEQRWSEAARCGRLLFACAPSGDPVGFSSLRFAGTRPLLDQVSVRPDWMRQGIGTALLRRAQHWSVREGELWLTTYEDVPWNRPWYERRGFRTAAPPPTALELNEILRWERKVLPRSEARIAMVFRRQGSAARI